MELCIIRPSPTKQFRRVSSTHTYRTKIRIGVLPNDLRGENLAARGFHGSHKWFAFESDFRVYFFLNWIRKCVAGEKKKQISFVGMAEDELDVIRWGRNAKRRPAKKQYSRVFTASHFLAFHVNDIINNVLVCKNTTVRHARTLRTLAIRQSLSDPTVSMKCIIRGIHVVFPESNIHMWAQKKKQNIIEYIIKKRKKLEKNTFKSHTSFSDINICIHNCTRKSNT